MRRRLALAMHSWKERTAEIAQRRARAERCLRHLVQRRLAAAFNSWHSNAAIAKAERYLTSVLPHP